MKWYYIKDGSHDGAFNMALDKLLLEKPLRHPVLRFYSWSPPAVSLGYNQKLPYYNRDSFDWHGIDLIRRPTGGRAVFHNREITYSVIIPGSSTYFGLSVHSLYFELSKAISAGLKYSGLEVQIQRNKARNAAVSERTQDCFSSTARFEITHSGRKLVGSAQRRMSSGILQHGSILLVNRQDILKELFSPVDDGGFCKIEDNDGEVSGNIGSSVKKDDIIESLKRGFTTEMGCRFSNDFDISNKIQYAQKNKHHNLIYSPHIITAENEINAAL